jgi:hypothetical protein
MALCFCPCLSFRAQIHPTPLPFASIVPGGHYATNTNFTAEEMKVYQQISEIIQSALEHYIRRGCLYNCCSMLCCPCLTDSESTLKIKALSREIGIKPEIQYVGYVIHTVRFTLPNRQINDSMEEITMEYFEGRWRYQGVPDEQSLKLRDEIDWSLFPQNECCFSMMQPFWPTSLQEWFFCFIFPWMGGSFVFHSLVYCGCVLTSPLWSCCSALRFKPEWIENPKISRGNLFLTTKSVSVKCPGYKYHLIAP